MNNPKPISCSLMSDIHQGALFSEISDSIELLFKSIHECESQRVADEVKRIQSKFDHVKPSTVDRACKLIQGRANVGQVKYGVSIDRDDLTASEWAQHALEEMLDGAQYLIRLKDEMEALQKENAELKNKNNELNERLCRVVK